MKKLMILAIGMIAVIMVIEIVSYRRDYKFYYDSTGCVAIECKDILGHEHWVDSNEEEADHNLVCAVKEGRMCRKCGKYITGAFWEEEHLETYKDGQWVEIGHKYYCSDCYK